MNINAIIGTAIITERAKLRAGQFVEIQDHHDNNEIAAAVMSFLKGDQTG